jgi:hypothetical protein
MLNLWCSVAIAAVLFCDTGSTVSLGGKTFSVTADKRQAQDLV